MLKHLHFARHMGLRYLAFRAWHELRRRTRWLRRNFPTDPAPVAGLPTLRAWRNSPARFFFEHRESLAFPPLPEPELEEEYQKTRAGNFRFFHSTEIDLGQEYDWVTHPLTGYRYDTGKHWTEIADFSQEAGDIKYVWEKARFSWLLTVIRYDYHFREDSSAFVFAEIGDFIDRNPVNCGPNYRCSQEISIRLMNWIFALYFYRYSPELNEERFGRIMQAIYWQVHHVRHNIHFSRIAVRNNHALTECLMLYLAGLLFPDVADFRKWKGKGKQWFEQEVAYQIYEDGTFLQFSMNYHRVAVQLLTWALRLSELNGERLAPVVYKRARRSLGFLRACMEQHSGWLPNYGMNDGALFFPLNNAHFRDYRPQLQALEYALDNQVSEPAAREDTLWISGGQAAVEEKPETAIAVPRTEAFDAGGYYLLRDAEFLTFIRCGRHKDRPHQADNLHLDLWFRGTNLLRDAGSYRYNTEERWTRYFNGTEGHNAVRINGEGQMLKGPRFIWFYWTQAVEARWEETGKSYRFTGTIRAFRHLGRGITHTRIVEKAKNTPTWTVTDEIKGIAAPWIEQIWHPHPDHTAVLSIEARDAEGRPISREEREGWHSALYGRKEACPQWVFAVQGNKISTKIEVVV
ncbi:MAG: alginate lyase family protein [Phaeodactylibacter sp.]|nr:alginate lyase family protein [Calditrichota bacterium]MCB0581756.1 alginate lyase family protein [Phaeodactylibacter sp.]MCB9294290.1 alginate lyase family protein [Lewinellaceae bacterium]